MNVGQVTTYFKEYIDEPDESFVTDARIQAYLATAYYEFQHLVSEYDPQVYQTSVDITLSGAASYDLGGGASTVSILGPDANLTHARMLQLNAVVSMSTSGLINRVWRPHGSLVALQRSTDGYLLRDTTLHFAGTVSDTVRLYYVPDSGYDATLSTGVDWSDSTAYIDDLAAFHDMIALYGVLQYSILDSALHEQAERQLARREVKLSEYLIGRAGPAENYVQRVLDEDYYA